MLDTLTSENSRDFNARYRGTYGWLINEDKSKRFVYIANVSDNEVTFQTMQGGKFLAYADKNVLFEFLPVTRGWFYGKSGTAYLISRRPARQWHRGICSANTNIGTHNSLIGRVSYMDFNSSTVADIFDNNTNPPAFSFKNDAIMAKQFAIFDNHLFFYDRRIGNVKDKKIVLDEDTTFLKQEITDIMKRSQFDGIVQ